jgi:hypothetical protein
MEMGISVITYAFHKMAAEGKIDLFGYLESCKYRYGLQTADIWDGFLVSLEEDYLRKVRDALDERELSLACLAVDGANLWDDDPERRKENNERAWSYLRAAEILGAQTVRMNSGGHRDYLDWPPEQFDHILERWQEYAQRAEEGGYRVGPENHWGPETVPGSLKKLCQAVDRPAFGVLLHMARWKGPDAESGDEMLAPWVMHTHISAGLDETSLPAKMALLRDRGYQGHWGIEVVAERYTEVGLWIARTRDVLESWRLEGQGS